MPRIYHRTDPTERFFRFVDQPANGAACWIWKGGKMSAGYGVFNGTGALTNSAHRWAYIRFRGPIPQGLCIDHLCHRRACVNPWHMEAVTMRENNLRSDSPIAVHARKIRCVHGHLLSGDNLHVTAHGYRKCRTCRRNLYYSRTPEQQERDRQLTTINSRQSRARRTPHEHALELDKLRDQRRIKREQREKSA